MRFIYERPKWQVIAIIALLVVMIISGVTFGVQYLQLHREGVANTELAERVNSVKRSLVKESPVVDSQISRPQSSDEDVTVAEVEKVECVLPEYTPVYTDNSDMVAWLCIPGTKIDYPVMFTPEDPEYYLRRGFDKKYASGGCLFVDARTQPDSGYIVIHGHNMKNGSMFGSLKNYAKKVYAADHPTISFDLIDTRQDFEVFSAFYSSVSTDPDCTDFRYYDYSSLDSEYIFDTYIEGIRTVALYDTGVAVSFGDDILILSTCSNHKSDGRFVVVAVKKQNDT